MLFAIRNGGFSGAIMPANIVVGDDAEAVADSVEVLGQGRLARAGGRRARPQGDPRGPGARARGRSPGAGSTRPLLDEALELDERPSAPAPDLEELRREKNEASKRIGELQRRARTHPAAIAEVKGVSAREKQLEAELREGGGASATASWRALPNPADPTAPDEDEVLREEGEAGQDRPHHVELLGERSGLEEGAGCPARASST